VGTTVADWREEEVGNETRSREINEWIDEANGDSSLGTNNPYVCECSDGSCTATIRLTHVEYEEVRGYGTHFAIAHDHESPDLDLMVWSVSGSQSFGSSRDCRRGSPTPRILVGDTRKGARR
jgi:hypothetical protein